MEEYVQFINNCCNGEGTYMSVFFAVFTWLADWLAYGVLGLDAQTGLGQAVHFFIEDVSKIFTMLVVVIYLIGLCRASMDVEKVRDYLHDKHRLMGYILAAVLGAITPFCSCSSIPLFLAFTAARIPIGITMAFLITSPIVNEVAVLVLGSVLGWQFTVIYVIIGVLAGIIGGAFFDFIKAERYLTDLGGQAVAMGDAEADTDDCSGGCCCGSQPVNKLGWAKRHAFAKNEVAEIVGRIWKWVIIGIAVGAGFHGFVPEAWVQAHLADGEWWTVPVASVLGIPLYTNATGIIPVAESMLLKGIPVGTVLTFMMSVVGASFPEFVMLKQVMKPRLLVFFFLLLLVLFTTTGWLFNAVAPYLELNF